MASSITDRLFEQVAPEVEHSASKITVVGVGQVGMASAYAMMIQHTVSELVLIDVVADKLRGEMMDLQHGECFLHGSTIKASTDYAASAGSKICIVTAGARQREGESRLDLVQRNVDIFKTIIPNLVKYSPDTILLIVSNPVDIMTYVSWKLSGLPQHRVIGSGTMLDSSRFRFLMSERLGIAARSCHAWVIGEHGDSSVAVWSGVNIAGVRLQDLSPLVGTSEDPENWEQIHQDVIKSAYEIIKLKGYTSWAIGLMVSQIVSNLLRNTKGVFALSTMVKGFHGVSQEVFLSVPCVIGENGISRVLCQTLNESEKSKLQHSASTLWEVQSSLKF